MEVTARDRQLVGVLAQARCLSMGQLLRLFWPRQQAQVMRRRLRALEKGPPSLVRHLDWYTRRGKQRAWTLTPAGYLEAEAELEVELEAPRDDVGVEYLDHHVLLTDLFVGLLAAPVETRAAAPAALTGARRARALGAVYASAHHPHLRWTVSGDVDLPWKEPAGPGGATQARVIRPDAILEFPAARRRLLVEAETGTHTIKSASPTRHGATLAKADRYEAFASAPAALPSRRTWYQARFPDGWRPEVLFLVRTESRVKSVQVALEGWRRLHPGAACAFHVATLEMALQAYLPLARQDCSPLATAAPRLEAPSAPALVGGQAAAAALSPEEAQLVRRYFAAVAQDFKARRDLARAQHGPVPDYPQHMQEMHALVKRLGS